MHHFSLLRSSELTLSVAEECFPLIAPWIPFTATRAGPSLRPSRSSGQALSAQGDILCHSERSAPRGVEESARPPLLHVTTATAFSLDADHIRLAGKSASFGDIDLGERKAELGIDVTSEHAAGDAYSMLTLSAAFLLGRMQHALMHAGAAIDPEGRAWLLVGDSYSGKTSTVVALVQHGWSYLADDQVVVSRGESGEVMVEGWPRVAHLDRGWSAGTVDGVRDTIDLREEHGDKLVRSAPLGGVLLPTVRADERTRAKAAHPAAVFSALVRQSPWLMADATAAPAIAYLLTSIASTHPATLSLGQDSYGRGEVIAECLESLDRQDSSTRGR